VQEGVFNEDRFRLKAIGSDSFGRSVARKVDFSRLPLCQHAETFLAFVHETHPSLLQHPQLHELDAAVLTIIYESRYQMQQLTPCAFNTCIKEVADELLDMIANAREELRRHPAGVAASAGLYVGEEEEAAE
jgi:hypothetical protein